MLALDVYFLCTDSRGLHYQEIDYADHRYSYRIGYDSYLVSSGGALITEAHDNFLFYFLSLLFYFFFL